MRETKVGERGGGGGGYERGTERGERNKSSYNW